MIEQPPVLDDIDGLVRADILIRKKKKKKN